MPPLAAETLAWHLRQRDATANPTYDLSGRTLRYAPCGPSDTAFTAACIVKPNVVPYWQWSMNNIGHASQFLLKCWSFWVLHEELVQLPRANQSSKHNVPLGLPLRRVLIDQTKHHRSRWKMPWAGQLMHIIGAEFGSAALHMNASCTVTWAIPTRSVYPGMGEAFYRQPWMAQRLSERILHATSSMLLHSHMSWHTPSSGQLSVGVIDRLDRRGWPASNEFVALVRDGHAPGPSIAWHASRMVMDNKTLHEQFSFIRSHDYLVSPHGQQNANWAFVRPCTVVLEIMPPQFLVAMYQQLAMSAGALAFVLYPGEPSLAHHAWETILKVSEGVRGELVARNFPMLGLLPAQTVLDALKPMMVAHDACRRSTFTRDASGPGRTSELLSHQNLALDGSVGPFDGLPTLGGAEAVGILLRADNVLTIFKHLRGTTLGQWDETLGYSRCPACGRSQTCCGRASSPPSGDCRGTSRCLVFNYSKALTIANAKLLNLLGVVWDCAECLPPLPAALPVM